MFRKTKKTPVTIDFVNGPQPKSALRCFHCPDGHLLLLGDEVDDHELWLVVDGSIELVGTLTHKTLQKVMDVGLSKLVTLAPPDFVFVQPRFKGQAIEAQRTVMRGLAASYSYREVCKCGKLLRDALDPCDCEVVHIPKVVLTLGEA